MFKEENTFEKFESKVWLSSPTMHGPEIEYVKEAYETNWMSTVGANINEVERLVCEKIRLQIRSRFICRNGIIASGNEAGWY